MEKHTVSAVVLAGGYSSRMGRDKAELILNGVKLIEYQVKKLKALGIQDIMLSGYKGCVEETRCIPDIYPHRGPLSGVHACLLAAKNPVCLTVGVDIPLVSLKTLEDLIRAHTGGVTVLYQGEKAEPLLAVYDCDLAGKVEKILLSENCSMKRFFDTVSMKPFRYQEDEFLLSNCNTPEEFDRIKAWASMEA